MAIDLEQGGMATGEFSGRGPEIPWIPPYLTVRDAAASIAFYEAAFGFAARNVMKGPDRTIGHAELRWNDGVVMMGPEGAYGGTTKAPATSGVEAPVAMYVYVPDVDALHDRAVAAGAVVLRPLFDSFGGDRLCLLADPDGHKWNFATNKSGLVYDHPGRN